MIKKRGSIGFGLGKNVGKKIGTLVVAGATLALASDAMKWVKP